MTRTSRLEIAMICHPSIGGSGILATELGHELALLGHRVTFISTEAPFRLIEHHENIGFESVNPIEFPLFKHPDTTLPLINRISSLLVERSFDLIHAHYAIPNAAAAVIARALNPVQNTRILTTLHGTDVIQLGEKREYHHLIEQTLNASDAVTTVSDNLKRITQKQFQVNQPIHTIHNFYREREITESRENVRKELGVGDEPLAIHVSNLRQVKRIDLLLNIFAEACRENAALKLLIIAGGDFSPYESTVRDLGITDRVIIRHNVMEVQNYVEAADVGVYTSEYESFCLGILESMAHGLPVLAFDVGGIHEVMDSGKTGYLLPFGDGPAMVDKINVLCRNAALRKEMGNDARKRASELFNPTRIVDQYLDLYDEVLTMDSIKQS